MNTKPSEAAWQWEKLSAPSDAERAVDLLRELPTGKDAAIIGHVVPRRAKPAILRTRYGAERVIEMPYGEDLPRIC